MRRVLPKGRYVRNNGWQSGATIFGLNGNLGWFWRDSGFPEKGEAPLSSDDSESESEADNGFHDSGLGTSTGPTPSVNEESLELPQLSSLPDGLAYRDYEVGIVCALSAELLAVRALFDCDHGSLKRVERDPNSYCLGSMNGLNVVAAGLPVDDYGNNSATNVASHMVRTFQRIKFCLLVGIGGGVPSSANDIRLGDVIVGTSVIQYDMGKHIQDSKFTMTREKQRPSAFLGSVITKIQSESPTTLSSTLRNNVEKISSAYKECKFPGIKNDRLFKSHSIHKTSEVTCEKCTGISEKRCDRPSIVPRIFYGLVASGNQVMRDARLRDRLGQENNVLCFDMEAAGVVRSTDCLIIRGICDYADSHKNKDWQKYASATAAAYAKYFLSQIPENHDIN
jgi:nucleoside phosphorylase